MIKQKNILTILFLAFIVVVAWVVLSVFHNIKTSTIDDATQVQIQPINPQFDNQVITTLQTRQTVAPLYSGAAVTSPVPTAVKGTPSPTKAKTISAPPASNAQPTGSGP